MQRVLVTGATGFVGSHLCRQLVGQGFEVAAVVRPGNEVRRIEDLLARVHRIPADMSNLESAAPMFRSFAPEVVFHLAWYGVANSYRNDLKQVSKNLRGSLELLRLIQDSGCKRFIGLGSQAEYGIYNRAISEDTPTRPATIYGTTKLAVGLLTQQLCKAHNMGFAWLRLFSCYGPDDNPGWLIPFVILTLLQGRRPILTKGTQHWDYLYVKDAVRALIQVGRNPEAQGIFNLASGQTYQVRTIVERIRDLINPTLPLGFGELEYRTDQIMHLQGNINRLESATGWTPHYNLTRGLNHTVTWFRDHINLYCAA